VSLRDEIGEQPDVVRRLLERARGTAAAVASEARARDVPFVLIAARGTSDHAAVYAQYALGVLAGVPVALAAPSVVSRYAAHPDLRRALVIGISQSGRSPDIVSVVAEAESQGCLTLAITNDPASPLAEAASAVLPLDAGPERAVAATKTYTAELVAVALLAAALADGPIGTEAREALDRVPAALALALETEQAARDAVAVLGDADECVVLGRGYHLATALEWALKLQELAQVRAHPWSTADFRHGPVASLPEGGTVLAVRAAGPLAGDVTELLESLRRERGARVLLLDDPSAGIPEPGVTRIPVPGGLPEWLSPIPAIVPAQLLCLHLTIARGLDPDAPRGLSKVTLTR
jgi:glucosamine--fructose-6-phosphate aminotransferase (isomerizing)